MKQYFMNNDITWKADETPLTIADTTINEQVIEGVKKHYPEHDVQGEEASHLANNSTFVWVCDPIDGTIPYSHNIPTAAFSLALCKDGKPIAAVIYQPWMNRLYLAEQGNGCTLNGRPCTVNQETALSGQTVVGCEMFLQAKYDFRELASALINQNVKIMTPQTTVQSSMLVASGELTASLFPHTTAHDGAAAQLIVEEAGGRVTDVFGDDQRYDQDIRGYIASNGVVHEELLRLLRDHVLP